MALLPWPIALGALIFLCGLFLKRALSEKFVLLPKTKALFCEIVTLSVCFLIATTDGVIALVVGVTMSYFSFRIATRAP